MAQADITINIDLLALEHVCYAAIKRERAHRDHALTFAHYMCVEQPKPAVVTIEPPKAKPALAGLGIVQDGRVRGVGFCAE